MSNPFGERPGLTRGQAMAALAAGDWPIAASAINGSNSFVGLLDELYALDVVPIFAASTSRLLGWPFNDGDLMARIRRASDNAEEDFSYVGVPPRLNFAGIDAHVAATTGRWRTWHNQCGTLLCPDAVQATDASQPLYVQNEGPDFNGSAYFMSVAHSANQLLTGGFTIACSLTPSAATGYIVSKAASGTSTGGFRLVTFTGGVGLTVNVNGGLSVNTPSVFTPETKYHTFTTVSAAGAVTFYVDNVSVATGTTSACSGITTTEPLRIGSNPVGSAGFFDGRVDDLLIIPGVISEAARDLIYAARSV